MKKSLFMLSVLSVFAMGFLFTSGAKNKMVSVKGYINYYGNEPFATPAFKTDDGQIFSMSIEEGAKFALDEILALQGNYLELTGIIEENEEPSLIPTNGTITIHSYKQAKQKKK